MGDGLKGSLFVPAEENLERFRDEKFGLFVLGGRITRAGIAWDAALRELKVDLLEKGDFAGGTSSRSSQLIHGGFRFLKTLQFRLVFEACSERYLLQRLVPRLVRSLPFLFLVYRDSPYGYGKLMAGMWLFGLLVAFKNVKFHQMLNRSVVLEIAHKLRGEDLQGGALYYDCLTETSGLPWK